MSSSWLWAAMALYGVVMFLVSPRAKDFGGFFSGRDKHGAEVGMGMLIGSVVISWLFAKSITNAANLGASFGLVGAVAYAGWYLSIPVAGLVIHALRTRLGIKSLAEFITNKYGVAATLGFTLVIMVRLFNEIWSNTAVVGAYFGDAGSTAYYSAALIFAGLTLAYSLRGGMRSSIFTDAIQFVFGLFLLVFILALIVPKSGVTNLLSAGEWTLAGGVDLLIVAVVQSLGGYAFHDPVLTDRAFINHPAQMLKGYLISGLIAGGFIVLFGLVGVHGSLAGIDVGQDAPLKVAQAFGIGATVVMSILMMISAGSTIDSTLSSFSKVAVTDLGGHSDEGQTHTVIASLSRWIEKVGPVRVGRATMILTVVLGSLPLFAGTAILKATTISGTMVLGLAPVFLLFMWKAAGRMAFHMAFWPGVAMGFWFAFGTIPEALHLGDGKYAGLLGLNVYGTLLIFALFALGAVIDGLTHKSKIATIATLIALPSALHAEEPPKNEPTVDFSGQTMIRLTTNMADLTRPSAEIYNVRLVGKVELDPFTFTIEPRLRQSNLRSFSPSNIWLQQAFASYNSPVPGLKISGGLLHNQLGLFWDDSWFGNIPYLNGHKLDPDMNLEVAYTQKWGRAGLESWLQFSPAEDGQNGHFATAEKASRVLLPADLEVQTNYREALAMRARIVPSVQLGPVKIAPGGSFQYSVYDRTQTGDPVITGDQLVWDAELTVTAGPVSVAGEYLDETVSGFTNEDLRRTYLLGKVNWTVLNRETIWLKKLDLGTSFQTADYQTEDFTEWMLTAHIALRLHQMVGFTAEYVREELSDSDTPGLDRIEWILHIHY